MTAETLDVGIGDYRVPAGAHIWALYSSAAERDDILRSYVRTALLSGDKCICVLDPAEAQPMMRTLTDVGEAEGIDLQARLAAGQLDLVNASEITTPSGQFSAAEKLDFWRAAIVEIKNSEKHRHIRFIGEMSSSLREAPVAREVVRFESELNKQLLPLYPQVHLCMYNLNRVGGAFLVDLVSAHFQVFVRGMLVENPYSVPPEEWLKRIGA